MPRQGIRLKFIKMRGADGNMKKYNIRLANFMSYWPNIELDLIPVSEMHEKIMLFAELQHLCDCARCNSSKLGDEVQLVDGEGKMPERSPPPQMKLHAGGIQKVSSMESDSSELCGPELAGSLKAVFNCQGPLDVPIFVGSGVISRKNIHSISNMPSSVAAETVRQNKDAGAVAAFDRVPFSYVSVNFTFNTDNSALEVDARSSFKCREDSLFLQDYPIVLLLLIHRSSICLHSFAPFL
eukprot:Gb_34396 [translate_table: standard]